jgi:hypothetical protein
MAAQIIVCSFVCMDTWIDVLLPLGSKSISDARKLRAYIRTFVHHLRLGVWVTTQEGKVVSLFFSWHCRDFFTLFATDATCDMLECLNEGPACYCRRLEHNEL